MAEPTQTTIIAAVMGIGVSVLGVWNWLFKRQIARIDDHDGRINRLEKITCTKDDLTDLGNKLETTITHGNQELQRTLGAAHRRIDDMYRDMPKRDS